MSQDTVNIILSIVGIVTGGLSIAIQVRRELRYRKERLAQGLPYRFRLW